MSRPPFSTWSSTDHSGPIIITTVLALVYWAVPGVVHQVITLRQSGIGSWADYSYILAMTLGLCQSILVLVASSHGLGKAETILASGQAHEALRLYNASSYLYVLVLALAKWSTTCAIINLTVPTRDSIKGASRKHKFIFGILSALTVAWACGSIIALAVECDEQTSTSALVGECTLFPSWIGIFVVDGVTDLLIVGFALSIILPTQARLRLKFVWFTPFFIRLCSVIFSGLRLIAYHRADIQRDPTIEIWLFVVLTQVSIFLCLGAAGFPAIKKTVLDLVTNYGVSEGSGNRSKQGNTYKLTPMSKRSKQSNQSSSVSRSRTAFTPYTGWNTASATPGAAAKRVVSAKRAMSDDDSQKSIMPQGVIEVAHSFTMEIDTASQRGDGVNPQVPG